MINSNAISEMRMGPDSNIGTAIIIGQNQGISTVTITNNSFSNNSRGLYPIVATATQNNVAAVAGNNVIDPIEVGLCRGTSSYPRTQDLYADPNFSGNCGTTATLNITVSGNNINLPEFNGGGFNQNGDGIDFNIGSNGILNASIFNNTIETLGQPGGNDIGDNGLTFDIRGSSGVNLNIYNNRINNSGDAAIGFSLQNTNLDSQPGSSSISIYGNTFGSAAAISRSLEIDLVNNTGTPVSQFYVNNTDQEINLRIRNRNFNVGPYPALYFNGSLWP
jgi:hypothetical protein